MSRVGKYPVEVPQGVSVTIANGIVSAKGKLGELSFTLSPDLVDAKLQDGKVVVSPVGDSKNSRMMWGTTRARIANLVKGVSEGFRKNLEVVGVGYKVAVQGKNLQLALGFSHDVIFPIPDNVVIKAPQPTQIEISGMDKQVVGQVAAEIRAYRPPEPYKGKGVKYVGEQILRKEGKKK
ncbi:50S ribosomal protein L6 [Haematospirillum jordaniae]|uniref:Large ribosomal subunit protein uL6 n=1 Tax=Haematospirillum jordaniae TaxID=1549855 RepID=A0A143DCX3_9PROT|nr:50S ribosomal protein L6 [Haematospirillum jordaniae]AMW33968.1 50S ribosomal protein L6 [Haematospirillum jordaniae]NKD44384.1 50S ribosomal protein L6 [Haematospirillum jordaniae]NKD57404.1 50S ribosomal protein L6 [Haematospirillum jordaniae]NKD59898.1 50S ribosomal protein L6 [Haematospirillum jordaniae]NKD67765.1 50S ribosomal protein L6 [Haematospirillum jordaniae]